MKKALRDFYSQARGVTVPGPVYPREVCAELTAGAGPGQQRGVFRRWRAAVAAFVLWPLVAWALACGLVCRDGLVRADALVVLSGSAAYDERASLAARLFREGRAPLVLLTDDGERGGWSSAEQRNPSYVELAAAELRGAGVPAENIRVLSRGPTNTYEEAAAVRAHAAEQGLRSLLVITSAYHSRRALWTWRRVFRGSGVEVGLEPAAGGRVAPAGWNWWLSADGWRQVAGEYVKIVYYAARY